MNVYIYFYTLQYTASNPFCVFSKGSDVIWSLYGESKLGHDISTIFGHFLAHALSSRNGCKCSTCTAPTQRYEVRKVQQERQSQFEPQRIDEPLQRFVYFRPKGFVTMTDVS